MDREKRIKIFGILAGLWMVGLIAAGILYREYVLRTGTEPPAPAPRPSTPLRPPKDLPTPEENEAPERRAPPPSEASSSKDSILHPRPLEEPDDGELPWREHLLATYKDGAGVSISSIDRTPTFYLGANESIHPLIDPDQFEANWTGALKILRGGKYQFSAFLAGDLQMSLGNVVVLSDNVASETQRVQSTAIELNSGFYPVAIRYRRTSAPARLQLFWKSSSFAEEPLDGRSLGHLESDQKTTVVESLAAERGTRRMVELGCTACHQSAGSPTTGHQGPNLEEVGQRVYAGWIDRWLAAPTVYRHDASMPELFSNDERGDAERAAITTWLVSRSKEPAQPATPNDEDKDRVKQGASLYATIGCSACHGVRPGVDDAHIPLGPVATKTNRQALLDFLQRPNRHFTQARMPSLSLDDAEAQRLAAYLEKETSPESFPAISLESEREQAAERLLGRDLVAAGATLFVQKRCSACHEAGTLADSQLPTRPTSFEALPTEARGCLAAAVPPALPRFKFRGTDRDDILAALKQRRRDHQHFTAPHINTRRTIARLNCQACHEWEGSGGISEAVANELGKSSKTKDGELSLPPALTGVGIKLRTEWLDKVLTSHGRARPWMTVRMPEYPKTEIGDFAVALAHLEGAEPQSTIHVLPFRASDTEDGRYLVSRRAFGCLKCHAIAGSTGELRGVRGPDLVETIGRVQYDWFRRWLLEPQRIAPGTKMPSNFSNGRSPVFSIHNGDALKQIDAIWAYLSLGENLPLPEGNDAPLEMAVTVTDRPVLIRTFLPDVGPRSIALGYPEQINFAFDAEAGRLAYGWTGNFIDIGPSWSHRGGQPANVLGKRFWSGPPGFPLALTRSPGSFPDFAARFQDTSFGAPLADRQFPTTKQLKFHGYDLGQEGEPIFHYSLEEPTMQSPVRVDFIPGDLRGSFGVGVKQEWRLTRENAEPGEAWLWVGKAANPPTRVKSDGSLEAIETERNSIHFPSDGPPVSFIDEQQKRHVLQVAGFGDWTMQKAGDAWLIAFHAPLEKETTIVIRDWVPFRDEAAVLRGFGMAPAE